MTERPRPEPLLKTRPNFVGFLIVGSVLGVALGAMAGASEYLAGDWQRIKDCTETYWTCTATVGGLPRNGGNELVPNDRLARSCREFEAWERSLRRARFDCSMSHVVTPGTCRMVEVNCELPGKLY